MAGASGTFRLPRAAEPLFTFLQSWSAGSFDAEGAEAAIDAYFAAVEEARAQIWKDGSREGGRASAMLEALERFEELGRAALGALELQDREGLCDALREISRIAESAESS